MWISDFHNLTIPTFYTVLDSMAVWKESKLFGKALQQLTEITTKNAVPNEFRIAKILIFGSECCTLISLYRNSNVNYTDVNLWACHWGSLEDDGSVPQPASLYFNMHWNSDDKHYCFFHYIYYFRTGRSETFANNITSKTTRNHCFSVKQMHETIMNHETFSPGLWQSCI